MSDKKFTCKNSLKIRKIIRFTISSFLIAGYLSDCYLRAGGQLAVVSTAFEAVKEPPFSCREPIPSSASTAATVFGRRAAEQAQPGDRHEQVEPAGALPVDGPVVERRRAGPVPGDEEALQEDGHAGEGLLEQLDQLLPRKEGGN